MPFYVYAWICNIFFGLTTVVGKLTSRHEVPNPWLLNFAWSFINCLLFLPMALAGGATWPTHWGPLWLVGLFSMLSGTLYVLSLSLLDVSVLSPLYAFRSVISVFLGTMLFGERLSAFQLGLVALIFIAGLFVSVDEKFSIRSFFRPSIAVAFGAIICSAIYGTTIKYAMQFEDYWVVTLWSNLLTMVPLLVTVPLFWKDVKKVPVVNYRGVLASALVAVLGTLAFNRAFAENVSITSAIFAVPTGMIFAFLFSVFAPKLLEKHSMKVYAVRFGSAAVMILAALKLTA